MYTEIGVLMAVLNDLHDNHSISWNRMSDLFDGVSRATLWDIAHGEEPADDDIRKKVYLLPKGYKVPKAKDIQSMTIDELKKAFENRKEMK